MSPGTFITEWTDGEKLCESFLAGGEEASRSVSEQLARIAKHYCFDGWLVNMENTLSVSCSSLPIPGALLPSLPRADPALLSPAGGSGEEPAPLPAALDHAGSQRRAWGAGDLV